MSYARSRTQVSTLNLSVLSLLMLVSLIFHGPSQLEARTSDWPVAVAILAVLGAYVLFSLPFDYLGGYVLPAKHGMTTDNGLGWLGKWARGAAVHLLLLFVSGYGMILMGQWVGSWGIIGWMAILMVLLSGFQYYLAMAVGGFRASYESDLARPVVILEHDEKAFTGGIGGLPGKESIVLPAYWRKRFSERVFNVLLARRHGAINTGSHGRGIIGAFLWNGLLFGLAVFLSHKNTGTVGGWAQTISYFSLFSLLSLWGPLPELSRRAVWELDRWIFYQGFDADALRESFALTSRLQPESPSPGSFLTRFQPLPAESVRQAQFAAQPDVKGAWHIATQVVFLSWAGSNLLARSGRSALGKPALWVFLPGD